MGKKLPKLALHLRAMTVFRSLLDDPVLRALTRCLENAGSSADRFVPLYGEFLSRLYAAGYVSLTDYTRDLVFDSDNPYIRAMCADRTPDKLLLDGAMLDLETLSAVASLDPDRLLAETNVNMQMAKYEVRKINLTNEYAERAKQVGQYGYGIFTRCPMLRLNSAGQVLPVGNPDPVRLSDLVDYEREKAVILGNTQALLEGKPAANMLLTGDAGTGKSSTVKAVANELWQQGLRILEVRKEQLHLLPEVLAQLRENPLKFILFIDDLSFETNDDNFSALKAMLEGSVTAKSRNVAIYATSNRRHLVKERFADREGDEIHRRDAMQETVSLSERFGLQVTFQRPDKATYLNIVRRLAEDAGLQLEDQDLCAQAERFALARSSRSARAARQFIDELLSRQKNP